MPARRTSTTARSSTAASSKPKRATTKPSTFVPGVAPTIAKTKRGGAKPKSAAKTAKKTTAKRAPKKSVKTPSKKAGVKTSRPKKASTKKAVSKKTAKKGTGSGKKGVSRKNAGGQPKYVDMIIEGIKSLHKKNGSSRQALERYIEENYPQRPDSKKWIRLTLGKLTKLGQIQKFRASYKLPPKNSTGVQKRSRSTKKRVTPKTPKMKPTKVAKAPKKSAKKAAALAVVGEVSLTSNATAAESSGKPQWQYQHNGWQNYDPEASDLVEVQYQEWLGNNQMFDVRSVKSGTWEYNVDFRRMVQTNIQHASHTERKIRRLVL